MTVIYIGEIEIRNTAMQLYNKVISLKIMKIYNVFYCCDRTRKESYLRTFATLESAMSATAIVEMFPNSESIDWKQNMSGNTYANIRTDK